MRDSPRRGFQEKNDQIMKRVFLCILDGWGMATPSLSNPISQESPFFSSLLKRYPHTLLKASGEAVGLPQNQMGNSEVGHMTMGLGRVVEQDLGRIDKALSDLETFSQYSKLQPLWQSLNPVVHVLGLLSPGGVHSHQIHLEKVVELLFRRNKVVKLHIFLDGRDTAPKSALQYAQQLESFLTYLRKSSPSIPQNHLQIATVSGRYYAMDRDHRWERTQQAYEALVNSRSSEHFESIQEAIQIFYERGITDEFIPPVLIKGYQGMQSGENLWMVNFRSDRVRQILNALLNPSFQEFSCSSVWFSQKIGMTPYSGDLAQWMTTLFEKPVLTHGVGEWVSSNHLKQLRIAETEKYAHVTFFWNGGQEAPYPGEDRILISSPSVATYDLKPEMAAWEITHALKRALKQDYQLIVANFANADMVGHTGKVEAVRKAIRTLDQCLEALVPCIQKQNWIGIITADHGNAEQSTDPLTGAPHTAHTCSPVPLILIPSPSRSLQLLHPGQLSDVAPTILTCLGLAIPPEMTGYSLID
jgi:2,3-bisphosphoglycerate-independent phosphoglycerate mutase